MRHRNLLVLIWRRILTLPKSTWGWNSSGEQGSSLRRSPWAKAVRDTRILLKVGITRLLTDTSVYGRSFTLSDPSCNKPNGVCQFSGGAKAGPCSGASGILNLRVS